MSSSNKSKVRPYGKDMEKFPENACLHSQAQLLIFAASIFKLKNKAEIQIIQERKQEPMET